MRKGPRAQDIRKWLTQPVIPVVAQTDADVAVVAEASLGFLQGCELSDLARILAWFKAGPLAHLPIMLHIDLLAGLTSDDAGLRYLAALGKIDGIITVRPHLVAAARKQGLRSILLLFLQDSRAVERGLHIVAQAQPDAIELVPGVAALEILPQFADLAVPRIAGGLIRTAELARRLLAAGCDAISTSTADLWRLNGRARLS
jgi:glycerol uptake operon antiterminator